MRGRFITFEGGEGSGKSTQARLLGERLRALGIGVTATREPGGSPAAEVIRHVLLSGVARPLGAEAETLLFAAARDDHLSNTIRPALTRGDWVICDRFIDSTRVYQGALGQVDPRLIRRLEHLIVGETRPDLTFVLDLPAREGMQRAAARRGASAPDRFEGEAAQFHDKLREAFRALAISEPARCVLIDATRPREQVATEIWALVEERLHPASALLEDTAS
jgi:dTMP kinase